MFADYGFKWDADWSQWDDFARVADDHAIADAIAANDPLGLAETYDAILTRSRLAVDQVIASVRRTGGNVLVVSHGSEIPCDPDDAPPRRVSRQGIDNGSVTTRRWSDGESPSSTSTTSAACPDVPGQNAGAAGATGLTGDRRASLR